MRVVACLCWLLGACAPQPVRCDLHLRPVNGPTTPAGPAAPDRPARSAP